MLRRCLFKYSERGDHRQRGNDPTDSVDTVLVKIFDELYGEHKKLFWDEIRRRTEFESRHDLLKGSVEIKRSLIAEDGILIESDSLAERFGVVDNRTVACRNALRNTRRSGCKHNVYRIGVDLVRADIIEKGRVFGMAYDFVIDKHFSAERIGGFPVFFVGDDVSGIDRVDDHLHSERRHLRVESNVVRARVDDAHKGDDRVRMLVHKHGYCASAAVSLRKEGSYRTRASV